MGLIPFDSIYQGYPSIIPKGHLCSPPLSWVLLGNEVGLSKGLGEWAKLTQRSGCTDTATSSAHVGAREASKSMAKTTTRLGLRFLFLLRWQKSGHTHSCFEHE